MDLSLTGKNALVCGSSQGIGKAAAIELSKLGANVTLVARDAIKLSNAKADLDKSKGQKHEFMEVDFTNSHDLKSKVMTLLDLKPIHILVNNTGGPPGGPILEAQPEAFIQAYHNHVICNHLLTQLVSESMVAENYGRIINIISTSVKVPINNLGVSNTTRAAVANWAKTMANELGSKGITVNNVLPGFTKTERLKSIIKMRALKTNTTQEAVEAKMMAEIPLGRFAAAAEVANAVAFLASPAAAYITGTNITVDGGRTKCY